MKGDVFFPTTFSPTPPLPINNKTQQESPPSSPSSTPPSTPPYSSASPASSFSSPTSAFSSPVSQYLSSSAPSHHSPFMCHSPPSSPAPGATANMADDIFFSPDTLTSTPFRCHQREQEDVEVEEADESHDEDEDIRIVHRHRCHHHHHLHRLRRSVSTDQIIVTKVSDGEDDGDDDELRCVGRRDEDDEDIDVDEDVVEVVVGEDVEEVEEVEEAEGSSDGHMQVEEGGAVAASAVALEVATFLRRVTLKPRRTLSLSPTPARPGDMSMGRNLWAACSLDYTDKDDDDGLRRPADSDTETTKRKEENDENGNLVTSCIAKITSHINNNRDNNNNAVVSIQTSSAVVSSTLGCVGSVRFARRGAILLGASSLPALSSTVRSSVKRPLEVTLPCQEIQYLDISYQKVQFSPIPRKKIAYHPVLHHTIHYCEVSYCSNNDNNNCERPVKRKPLVRSHSFAVSDLRERVDSEWNYKFR